MPMDLAQIPLVDHHCHALLHTKARWDAEAALRSTSEAPLSYPIADLEDRLIWHAMLNLASETTGTRVTNRDMFGALMQNMSVSEYEAYSKTLFQSRNYRHLYIDTGYAPNPAMSEVELAQATGADVSRILRLEVLAQSLWSEHDSFADWWAAFQAQVQEARAAGYIGAKSIIAYRTGLSVQPVAYADAKQAFAKWKASTSSRLTDETLLNFIVWESAPWLIKQALPLQFHVGYGDPDTNLLKGNPLHLRTFIEEYCTTGLSIALLHTYPYHREAGFLASVYPGVYFDVSLIVPLGLTSAIQVVAEALELTPLSRFLFASDAHTRPETFAISADLYREALQSFFTTALVSRQLTPSQAEAYAAKILHNNALSLYGQTL